MNVTLLRKIITAIKKEPRRFDMLEWIDQTDQEAPCGTAACIAGYAVILSRQKPGKSWAWAAKAGSTCPADVSAQARKLLRLSLGESRRLFLPNFWPKPFPYELDMAVGRRDKAKVAVERIEHFIKTHGNDY